MKQLASQLGFGYRQCGEVMVAKTKAEFDALTELSLQAKQQGKSLFIIPFNIYRCSRGNVGC